MSRETRIDLFCEDRAHEELLRNLLARLCAEEGLTGIIEARSVRGGHGKALQELRTYQRVLSKGQFAAPDLLVVGIDANCSSYTDMVRQVDHEIDHRLTPYHAIACPDPHVERWYMCDPVAFEQVIGVAPPPAQPKCGKESRNVLKRALADAVRRAGHPAPLGGVEFAAELAAAMDPFRAGKADPALRHFLDDVTGALRLLKERIQPNDPDKADPPLHTRRDEE